MAEKAESIKFRDGISGRNYFVMCKTREKNTIGDGDFRKVT